MLRIEGLAAAFRPTTASRPTSDPVGRVDASRAWPSPRHPHSPAFTIIELLVVIAIIATLVGVLIPALSNARSSARKVDEMSAARQLMIAHASYASANEDWVLPGYLPGLPAFDERKQPITNPVITARYPWRIAPYLDYNFRGLYKNDQEDTLEQMQMTEHDNYIYVASLSPSLGYNASWIGGNKNQLGFSPTALKAFGPFYVTRSTEVRNPSSLIVFCSARGIDPLEPGATPVEGYFEVRSPRFTTIGGQLWPETYDAAAPPGDFGFISLRHKGEAVVALFDGHTDAFGYNKLLDMRHWSNRAEAPDSALAPLAAH